MRRETRKAQPTPAGRPSIYTNALADLIAERVAAGEGVRAICLRDDMPAASTVYVWMRERPDFRIRIAHAREAQGDLMDERILQVADACKPETAAADRVKIDAYKWRAARLAPKKYGDKVALVGGDPETDSPVQVMTDFERAKAMLALIQKAKAASQDQ